MIPLQAHAWRDVTFVSWAYEPDAVQRLLPAGLTAATHDGKAWVSLVLLRMRVGLPLTRSLTPGIGVLEANLRTYVTGPDGVPGIYFFSIDCDRWSLVAGGRAVGVRYVPARQSMSRNDTEIRYEGTRFGLTAASGPSYDATTVVGEPMTGSPTDRWLVDQNFVYGSLGPALTRTPGLHTPWPLRTATVSVREELQAAAGLPTPAGEPLIQFSCGVDDVVLGLPTVFTPA